MSVRDGILIFKVGFFIATAWVCQREKHDL